MRTLSTSLPAKGGRPSIGVGLVEIDRMILADRFAVEFDRLPGQRVGNGLARFAGDDMVPDLSQIGMFPEIGLEGFRLRRAILPVSMSCRFRALSILLYGIINLPRCAIEPLPGKPRCPN